MYRYRGRGGERGRGRKLSMCNKPGERGAGGGGLGGGGALRDGEGGNNKRCCRLRVEINRKVGSSERKDQK